MTFTLPNLPYAHDALAPYMSKETLEFHHDKHHQAYVTNGNNAIKGTEFEGKSLEEIVKASFGKNPAVFNNAGQHYNHLHFWNWMKPNGGGSKLPGRLEKKITEDLGGLDKFKTDFAAAGVGQFGSGWCWLSVKNGKLEISKTANGESPLVHGATPILGCDVWEHSYYIDYRNRRPDYLKAFVDNLVNWDYVDELFGKADAADPSFRGDAKHRTRNCIEILGRNARVDRVGARNDVEINFKGRQCKTAALIILRSTPSLQASQACGTSAGAG